MVRIDMSEYMERHTTARLIGAPPGYVGYDEGGQLTEAVRRRPYAVVLFDECEKAHPEVFGVLLQLLDEGRLTDGHGRTVDFSNTVVLLTSNLGSDLIFERATAGQSVTQEDLEPVLRQTFRPEFLNRIDRILVFNPLSREVLEQIVDIQVGRIDRLLEGRDFTLRVTPEARSWLAREGYDPAFGARPLARVIDRHILNPLSQMIIEERIPEGGSVVEVRVASGTSGEELELVPVGVGQDPQPR
jgi:ATP-dependent Clp protease ATP-binding subunit ClpB